MSTTEQFVGRVLTVRGQIVIVRCESDYRPALQELLSAQDLSQVLIEVHSYKERDLLYCLLLTDKSDLKRNMHIVSRRQSLSVPVGKSVLGRAINLYGKPVDGGPPLSFEDTRLIDAPGKKQLRQDAAERRFLDTGIKALDFFTPLLDGGNLALVGGAGVGKTVLMTEIIRNLNSSHPGVTLYTGIGERIREGHELWLALKEAQVLEKTALIVAHINENAAVRLKVASAAATLAEYFRDEAGENVLFFADNVFRFVQAGNELSTLLEEIPSEYGYQSTLESDMARFQSRLGPGDRTAITSVQTVYVPADELSDPSLAAALPYFEAVVILSREMAQEGRFPAIDLLNSKSSILARASTDETDAAHVKALTAAIEVLQQYQRIARIVNIIGESELTPQDKLIYQRASRLRNYMTQPFYTQQGHTGRGGVFVKRSETIQDVDAIMRGDFDDIAPEKFMYIGRASEVRGSAAAAAPNPMPVPTPPKL